MAAQSNNMKPPKFVGSLPSSGAPDCHAHSMSKKFSRSGNENLALRCGKDLRSAKYTIEARVFSSFSLLFGRRCMLFHLLTWIHTQEESHRSHQTSGRRALMIDSCLISHFRSSPSEPVSQSVSCRAVEMD